jgi:hypothetical protein
MKTKLFLFLFSMIMCFQVFGQEKTCEIECLNFVQTNETEFRFDVRIRNTTANPTVEDYNCTGAGGAFAIDAWNIMVGFNTAILNGGKLSPGYYLFLEPGSSELATAVAPKDPQIGTDQTAIVASPDALANNVVTTVLNHSNWVKIGTFIVKLRNVDDNDGTPSVARNFASVASGFNVPNDNIYNAVAFCSYNATSRRTLTASGTATCTAINSLGNKPFFSHCYTGTGSYTDPANWNNYVDPSQPGYHALPSASDNVSFGSINDYDEVTTFADLGPVAASCSFTDNQTIPTTFIANGSSISIAAGKQFTANNAIINEGVVNLKSLNGSGTATILTPGTLSGAGTYNVEQYMSAGRNWYISSPIESATASDISTTGTVVSRDEAGVSWPVETSTLVKGKGYIADHPTAGVITFDGVINSGDVQIPLTYGGSSYLGYNLVGNPYPSYINWSTALATSANVATTIWYRAASTFYTYNASGNISSGAADLGAIPPMQAFWVKANAAGTLTFTNALRSHAVGTSVLRSTDDKQILRLQVSNGKNVDEAIVYTTANALNTYDDYDSPKMTNSDVEVPEIYTMIGSEKLVINGFNEIALNTEIPLGFKTGQANSFTITAKELTFNNDVKVLLKDKLLGVEKELTTGLSYSFESGVTSTSDRFSVLFKSAKDVTDLNKNEASNIEVFQNENKQITVRCMNLGKDAIATVYSLSGQKIYSEDLKEMDTVLGTNLTSGIYLVTVKNGGVSTKAKVILK